LLAGGLALPHFWQIISNLLPQALQNLASSLLSALQFGHFILFPLKEKGSKKIQDFPEASFGRLLGTSFHRALQKVSG